MLKKRSLSLLGFIVAISMLLPFLPKTPMALAEASELDGHWAKQAVELWNSRGIITGYEDGSLRPDGSITRAEFAALVNRTFGFVSVKPIVFTDVHPGDWFSEDIQKAFAAGYMQGYTDGTVGPNRDISRQEAAVVLARLKKLDKDAADFAFTDADAIAAWSKAEVMACAHEGLVKGYTDGSFGPEASITRAETVTILDRMFAEIYKEPGVYGSTEATEIDGGVVVASDGVTLRNLVIKGDLLIAQSVEDGEVTLENVVVEGNTQVSGGGSHSVILIDSILGVVIVDKENVTLAAEGKTKIDVVSLLASARVEERDIEGDGIGDVILDDGLAEDSKIVLVGNFKKVEVNAGSIILELESGHIIELETSPEVMEAISIVQQAESSIGTLILNSPAEVSGDGVIEEAQINSEGSTIEQKPKTVKVAEGVTAEVGGEDVGHQPPPTGGDYVPTTIEVSAVSVEGDVVAGSTLTAATAPNGATVTYQWQIAEADQGEEPGGEAFIDIDNATSKTYRLVEEDKGKYVRVMVDGYGTYTGTKTSDVVGPVATPANSIYKISYEDLADSYVVGELVTNGDVDTAIAGLSPVQVTLSVDIEGTAGYGAVRIAPVDAGEHIQFWAKDTSDNWYDINVDGWGPSAGFPVPKDSYDVTTGVYILSDAVGTYELDVKLVNVDDHDEVLAEASGTVVVREPAHSEYGFSFQIPEAIVAGVETEPTPIVFEAVEEKELGYARVRFSFEASNLPSESATVTFKATDTESVEHTFVNIGVWGPETGFPITKDFRSDGPWKFTFSEAGDYTIDFRLTDLDTDVVIAEGSQVVTVISEQDAAKAAIKPSWAIEEIEGIHNYGSTLETPAGVDGAEYRIRISTVYEDRSNTQASGRTVTTYFTVPHGVTAWYPFVDAAEPSVLEWKSTADGEGPYVIGMAGHPLCDENIDVDGYVYVALGSAAETEFEFTIKLVDADENWESVVYGEQTLTVTRSEYEFEVASQPGEIYAVGIFGENATNKITIGSDDGSLNTPGVNSLEALKTAVLGAETEVDLDDFKIQVSLTVKSEGDFGHTNRNVMIEKLSVTDRNGEDVSSKVKVYLYAHQDAAWYDLVQCVWGDMGDGRGFNQGANETNELLAYVFASEAGAYTITFKAIDIDNNGNVICEGSAEIVVSEYGDE